MYFMGSKYTRKAFAAKALHQTLLFCSPDLGGHEGLLCAKGKGDKKEGENRRKGRKDAKGGEKTPSSHKINFCLWP